MNASQGAVNALGPHEIGHAPAYEAYRIWIHNTALCEPLGGEIERQKEALVALAVAEVPTFSRIFFIITHTMCCPASRMYMISRLTNVYGRVPACEAAAATALLIFDEVSSRIFNHLDSCFIVVLAHTDAMHLRI